MGTIDPTNQHQLDEHGFLVLDGLMDATLLRELQQRVDGPFEIEGEHSGS